jgi:hypothetical protein
MPVVEKLNCGNHVLWKAQVLAVLRGAQLDDFLDAQTRPRQRRSRSKSREDWVRKFRKFQI